MDMRADDSLPKMALFYALAFAAFGVAGGAGLGGAFFSFLLWTLFSPHLALLLAYPFALWRRRVEALRLWEAWILAGAGTLWALLALLIWRLS